METKKKHKKLPWVYSCERQNSHDFCVHTAKPKMEDKGRRIASVSGVIGSSEWTWLSDEDVEFILRACNNHYKLLKAVKDLKRALEKYKPDLKAQVALEWAALMIEEVKEKEE